MSNAEEEDTQEVSARIRFSKDQDDEFGALTDVDVDITWRNRRVGSMTATIVNRRNIPPNFFMAVMDGHSSDLQFVGTCLFEPKRGRTKLQSLAEYDMPSAEFMYISTLHVEDECKMNGASHVGAMALSQLLNHPRIRGTSSQPKVAIAIYILDAKEAMTDQERRESDIIETERRRAQFMEELQGAAPSGNVNSEDEANQRKIRMRADANQFLRNGVFQDPAMARKGHGHFLVASHVHWTRRPIKAHDQAAAIAFVEPTAGPASPSGKDLEILNLVMTVCGENAMNPQQITKLVLDIQELVNRGGSIVASHALHCAVANNSMAVVQVILEMEPAAINSRDIGHDTPLMIAAVNAAGRKTNAGIAETRVIDRLLAAGASKDLQGSSGMTAYGAFKRQVKEYDIMMHAMTGGFVARDSSLDPSVRALEAKLLPTSGPTAGDLVGGETDGFVQYSDDDISDEGDY